MKCMRQLHVPKSQKRLVLAKNNRTINEATFPPRRRRCGFATGQSVEVWWQSEVVFFCYQAF